MWDALLHGFAESRNWFDLGPGLPMLRIQGDAQLLKALLLESLRDPLSHFQHSKSQDCSLIENDLHFQQCTSTLQPILNRNSCDGFCLPFLARRFGRSDVDAAPADGVAGSGWSRAGHRS